MPTMNISLPGNLKKFVESQVESGSYSSVSEFMRELLRRELREREREQIEQKLLDGLNSGESIEATPQMWRKLRQEAREAARKKKPRNGRPTRISSRSKMARSSGLPV
jgi:antitoxin ParD1/3/4